MVLYDRLPRPRRSITSAAARADRCDSSFRTGSSSASRAAAAAAFFAASLLTEEPSFLPRALAAARPAMVRWIRGTEPTAPADRFCLHHGRQNSTINSPRGFH